jgi:hypothetical protein
MVKASDFRAVFPGVDQKTPVYRHSHIQRNQPVKGADASLMKFPPLLCEPCNNARTQPHDRAWEALVDRVLQTPTAWTSGSRLPIADAFGGAVRQSMLGIHLYFLKLLGCHATQHSVPLPIGEFAEAIRKGVAHKDVRLRFYAAPSNAGRRRIIVGNIHLVQLEGATVAATWSYVLGPLGVHIVFDNQGGYSRHLGWHPSDGIRRIRMR